MTRRTSVAAIGSDNKGEETSEAVEEHPKITVGVFTNVGDPDTHANEDRATVSTVLMPRMQKKKHTALWPAPADKLNLSNTWCVRQAVLDLLGKFGPQGVTYNGTANKMVSFFGVYDGHGGSACSEYLRRNLHVNIAANLYKDNYHEKMKEILIKVGFFRELCRFEGS